MSDKGDSRRDHDRDRAARDRPADDRTDTDRPADDRPAAEPATDVADRGGRTGHETTRPDENRASAGTNRATNEYNPGNRGRLVSALIALLGVWMVVEALWFDLVAAQVWNDLVVGVLLLAAGGYNLSRRSDERVGSMGAAVFAALLGLWLVASPLMFGADTGLTEAINDAGFWNDVVVGLLALVLGAYSAYQVQDQRRRVEPAPG